ncbi:MAG: tetratricopeptide repeat protein [Promethearchaeota archaeon]|jgi:tetratricopeptide (TPR) repeat protein
MTLKLPKELDQARELMYQAKFGEALEILEHFEKGRSLTPKEKLSLLLIRAKTYAYARKYAISTKVFEQAYNMSQNLGLVPESIMALLGMSSITMLGEVDKATNNVNNAERLLKSIEDDPSSGELRINLLFAKSWVSFHKGNMITAAKFAQESLELAIAGNMSNFNNFDLADLNHLLGWINLAQGDRTKALEHTIKSLEINREVNHDAGIAADYSLIANIYRIEGDYDQALQYCKKSLSIKEIANLARITALTTLSDVYMVKSDLNRALKYQQKAVKFAEELNISHNIILGKLYLGKYYRLLGKKNLAIESYERALILSEKLGFTFQMASSLRVLIAIYIDEDTFSREIANRYFSRLSELYNQTKDKGEVDISFPYLAAKADILKTSTRMRDHVEAQAIFKQLIDLSSGEYLFWSMANLSNLLLEELSIYNDLAILDEITPIITKCLVMAEKSGNYHWLAEIKVLQAKLALIQMKTDEAKILMVQAQRIADLHGLKLLALRISFDHDKLLDQMEIWDNIKKEETPMAERIKLASTNGVLDRIQGKRAVESPEMIDEQATLLMIIAKGGFLIFSYPFTDEWKQDETLFSSFLSAFTSFSDDFLSEGLDRVKFDQHTVLIESVSSFSVCYLYKGQTYPAKQKLSKFTEAIQNNTSIWPILEKFYKTSQILEIKDSPFLEHLITNIFIT